MADGQPQRHGQGWSLAEEQQLYDEYTADMSVAEIAALHERAPGGIRSSLRRLGLTDEEGKRVVPAPPFTPTDAAQKRESKSVQKKAAGERRRASMESALNPEQNERFREALHLMGETNQNLFITGKAGTGKSTLLSYFCRTTDKQPVVLAPTGVAALNVKGQTIHSFFGFGVDVTVDKIRTKKAKPRNAKLYKKLKMIVIDEVSMVRTDLLDCIDMFLQLYGPIPHVPFGGVQMVFIGDLYQLPPVVTTNERQIFSSVYPTPYFFSARVLAHVQLERVELDKIYRQKDQDFVALLNRIRNNTVTRGDLDHVNTRVGAVVAESGHFSITLTTTNATADGINEERLTALPGKLQIASAKISGDFTRDYYPTAPELAYKIGAQVMMLNNDAEKRWVNGSIGLITGARRTTDGTDFLTIELQDSGDSVSVLPYTWEVYHFGLDGQEIVAESAGSFTQFPFRLAWGITIHKSQGKTFDRVVIDTGRGAFAAGQIYVALSRCTSFEGVSLKVPIKLSDIRSDTRIADFLNSGQAAAEHAGMIDIIHGAIAAGAPLDITYLKADDTEISCSVTPLSVGSASYQGYSYQGMKAQLPGNAEPRMFRLDRIRQIGWG